MEGARATAPAALAALLVLGAGCPRAAAAASETCTNPTGGVIPLDYSGCLGFTGRCYHWMNATCDGGDCVCDKDSCIIDSQCVPRVRKGECTRDTGGTCIDYGCDRWRNSTCSVQDRRCLCSPGSCPVEGECRPPGVCAKSTGGTCKVLGCQAWRQAWCSVDGVPGIMEQARCMCGGDSCPINGECVPKGGCPRYTVSSCGTFSWLGFSGCDAGECQEGFCRCGEGACSVDGACVDADLAAISLSREWAAAQGPHAESRGVLALGGALAGAFAVAAIWTRSSARAVPASPADYESLEG